MLTPSSNTRLVFIGDSITDCGRINDPEKIGCGYVRIIRDWLMAKDPGCAPEVINKGVSGNKVNDLHKRWQEDVLDLKPDVLSIKIGINDVWHNFLEPPQGISLEEFVRIYEELLDQVKTHLPECQIVLCEPTVIWPPAEDGANEQLKHYCQAVRELAVQVRARAFAPLHGAFEDAKICRPDVSWTTDGVHPTSTGHMLIARQWLKATRAM